MHADLILIILAALVVLAVVYRGLVYLPPRNLPGTELTERQPGAGEFHTDDRPPDTEPWGTCDWGGCDEISEAWRWDRKHGWLPVCQWHTDMTDRDPGDWADRLHEINQLGKFGDLTRPVAHLTHYEVEALIRTLAVPEWVPDRYRMAA